MGPFDSPSMGFYQLHIDTCGLPLTVFELFSYGMVTCAILAAVCKETGIGKAKMATEKLEVEIYVKPDESKINLPNNFC